MTIANLAYPKRAKSRQEADLYFTRNVIADPI